MSTATELLRRVIQAESHEMLDDVLEEIEIFLAAEPEAEPVAWMHVYKTHKEPNLFPLLTHECEAKGLTQYPLYTRHSPARKPMTEEEIDEEIATNEHYCERSFAEGVRWAEKHHGISGDD